MNCCGKCTFPMKELTDFVYQCTNCQLIIDEQRHVCIFKVGPYHITLFDTFGIDTMSLHKTQIMKGLQSIYLSDELPLDVDEDRLNYIWKMYKEN